MRSALSRVIAAISLSPRGSDVPRSRSNGRAVSDDLIPDAELARRELAEDGGYMWQGSLAAATGWSSTKTSRVLCKMEQDGRIHRWRIGRRKIVCLPGSAPSHLQPTGQHQHNRAHPVVGEVSDD